MPLTEAIISLGKAAKADSASDRLLNLQIKGNEDKQSSR